MCTHCAPAHTHTKTTTQNAFQRFGRFHNCLCDDANDDDDVDDGDPCASVLCKRTTMMYTSITYGALDAVHCNPFPFIQFGKYNANVKSETISCTRNTNCIYYLVQVRCDDVWFSLGASLIPVYFCFVFPHSDSLSASIFQRVQNRSHFTCSLVRFHQWYTYLFNQFMELNSVHRVPAAEAKVCTNEHGTHAYPCQLRPWEFKCNRNICTCFRPTASNPTAIKSTQWIHRRNTFAGPFFELLRFFLLLKIN